MLTRRTMIAATGIATLMRGNRAWAQQREMTMDIKRAGSQPSRKAPAEYFSGAVGVDPLFQSPDPGRTSGSSVTFEPGARTVWHTHPLGQTLIITSGFGWVQREGGPIEEVCPGDVVWFPPGLKHWHGATPTTALTHIAIQEALDGKNVEWMERSATSSTASNRRRWLSYAKPIASPEQGRWVSLSRLGKN
jgi:quercetin dioxygenase-like cupin family protein